MDTPHWLPAMVSVNGNWNQVIGMLYGIFESDIKQAGRRFEDKPVWWDRRVLDGEIYEEGFWHLVSKDDCTTKDRLFDPRRSERLPWCGPTIGNAGDNAVKVWDFKDATGRVRTYLWLEMFDYVVILEKRKQRVGEIALLITAFYVDGDSTKRNLRRKYDNRIA